MKGYLIETESKRLDHIESFEMYSNSGWMSRDFIEYGFYWIECDWMGSD